MPNRLAHETSPYLLQHAHNPVDWYPWGDEAFARAKADDKPIFLSIGYAACHWCHVMERESFEDSELAAYLNDNFVSIKVDREERPDLDGIHMDVVQAITGRGGWPMSVWLTPDAVPFYGGTYFPPTARPGMPSFRQVLEALRDKWDNDRDAVTEQGSQLVDVLGRQATVGARDIPDDVDAQAMAATRAQWDETNGGIGGAPKFPQAMLLDWLLRRHVATGDTLSLRLVEQALTKMAAGGLYDQLGGGFHRYCVDGHWGVPHFEKMLYDNALLVPVYLHAFQLTANPHFRRVVEETLDYLVAEMRQPEGGISSTQDADSEGVEGKFFVWRPAELRAVLGDELGDAAATFYGVTPEGNFDDGATVLWRKQPAALTVEAEQTVRAALLAARHLRVAPATDDKVLASWNGLALAAFAEAARVLDRPDWLDVGVGIAEFCASDDGLSPGGVLHHTWRADRTAPDGPAARAQVPAFCEDVAALGLGLLELYRSTFDPEWFRRALACGDDLLARFADPAGGFFGTADDAETLIVRPKDITDNAVPSPNSLAADLCARLYLATGESRFHDAARRAVACAGAALGKHPSAFGRLATVHQLLAGDAVEIAVVGDTAERNALLAVVDARWRPFAFVAAGDAAAAGPSATLPLLADRAPRDGTAAAYVCRQMVCAAPVTTPDALASTLGDT